MAKSSDVWTWRDYAYERVGVSGHLPECIYAPRNVDPDKGIEWGGLPCICGRLQSARDNALRDAVEAVKALPTAWRHDQTLWVNGDDAVAAIEALGEER